MKTLPDYLPKESRLVIIGCNPSLVAARTGFYYSGRGNQFWSLLHESRLVPERLRPLDTVRLSEFAILLLGYFKSEIQGLRDAYGLATRQEAVEFQKKYMGNHGSWAWKEKWLDAKQWLTERGGDGQ